MDRLPVMLAPLGFLELNPPQLIELAASSGFQSVGLRTVAAVQGGPEYPIEIGNPLFNAIRESMQATGVNVDVVEVVVLSRNSQISDLLPMLEAAHALGAKRVLCNGDDTDKDAIAEKFAELCDLSHPLGMAVELEFMRFRRGIQTLGDASYVVQKANRLNGYVVMDALHFFRSGGSLDDLKVEGSLRLSSIQLCDAPKDPPSEDELAMEARNCRLPLGEGELPLKELMDAMPKGIDLAIEIPMAAPRAQLTYRDQADILSASTRQFLTGYWAASQSERYCTA
jgi:sugar phosphate isomerase/epimerase